MDGEILRFSGWLGIFADRARLYPDPAQTMNFLNVGADKSAMLGEPLPNDNFILIDDGPFIEAVLKSGRTVRVFDPSVHSFDPFMDMTYRKKRSLRDLFAATFTAGPDTLKKDEGLAFILDQLDKGATSLATLIPVPDRKATPGHIWAYDKVRELRLSPVLKDVLERPDNFSLKGTILVRLDRSKLGSFDCRFLARLFMALCGQTIVVPDFGAYALRSHEDLIRENRLVAGINFFDEVPALSDQLKLIEWKVGSQCTYEDAVTLAKFAGLKPDPTRVDCEFNQYVDRCMGLA